MNCFPRDIVPIVTQLQTWSTLTTRSGDILHHQGSGRCKTTSEPTRLGALSLCIKLSVPVSVPKREAHGLDYQHPGRVNEMTE